MEHTQGTPWGGAYTGHSGGAVRGDEALSALKPAVDPYLCPHTSCTLLAAKAGVVLPYSWQLRKVELPGPPGDPSP